MAADPLAPLMDLPGVADGVRSTREAVDLLLSHRVLRQDSARVSAESALRGARASAALEGREFDVADLRAGRVTDATAQGALRVTAEVGSLLDVWLRAPSQALARLHMLAARDLTDDAEQLGRPLADPGVSARLDQLSRLLAPPAGAPRTEVSAVLVAGVVHGELLALAPFSVGSGLVARAAERLTLISRGLDPKGLVIPELGHYEAGGVDAYRALAGGFAAGTPSGLAQWLVHCCRAVTLGAREATAVCESIQRG